MSRTCAGLIASSRRDQPPDWAKPLVRFSADDTTSLYTDVAGTTTLAATGAQDGTVIRRWRSTGTLNNMHVTPVAAYLDTAMTYRAAGTTTNRPLVEFPLTWYVSIAEYSVPQPLAAAAATGASMVCVFRLDNVTDNGFFWNTYGSAGHISVPYNTSTLILDDFGLNFGNRYAFPYSNSLHGTCVLYAHVANATTGRSRVYLNDAGTAKSELAYGSSNFTRDATVRGWKGGMAEFRLYDFPLTVSDLAAVFANLGRKYGVAGY